MIISQLNSLVTENFTKKIYVVLYVDRAKRKRNFNSLRNLGGARFFFKENLEELWKKERLSWYGNYITVIIVLPKVEHLLLFKSMRKKNTINF